MDLGKRDSIISNLLEQAGLSGADFEVEACDAGGNNRVLAVRAGGQAFAAKWYFTSSDDSRDRLDTEWRFLQYARNIGIDCIPSPLAYDIDQRVALYDFIEGAKIVPGVVSRDTVDQAADFFNALNTSAAGAFGPMRDLPVASEACFSIDGHFALVDRRLDRLGDIVAESDVDHAARTLVGDLKREWEKLKIAILKRADELGIAAGRELDENERCISPSDFGFHNAIVTPEGKLYFIDFEYAGWDDSAKMVGDFFSQPAVPVGSEYYNGFVGKVTAVMPNPEAARARADLLRPVFGLKWCCIMLNAFVPEWSKRRTFANPKAGLASIKARQLAKAERAYKNLQPICARFGA